MSEKPRRTRKTKEISKNDEKKVLAKHKEKLESVAEKIALKTMTEMQLATQAPISEQQKAVAKLIASGLSDDEIFDTAGISSRELEAWKEQPSFVKFLNEEIVKSGFSDKNERIRKSKRIAEAITDKMMEKIVNGELDNVPMSTLSKLAMEWSQRVDQLVDKKEEKTNKDLTVLILNHVQESASKKYDKLEDFLSDPEFKFPVLDTTAVEINDDN